MRNFIKTLLINGALSVELLPYIWQGRTGLEPTTSGLDEQSKNCRECLYFFFCCINIIP